MEPKSSLKHDIPPHLNGHLGYGAAVISGHISSQHYHNNTSRQKSKVRLNDQLIPKPTDINMAEKMIKTATPKEHPYASHISKFAMFPSFCSPDDPETGVRAASQTYFNQLIPYSAPDVTLLSKTIGSPYRHEVLRTPMKTRKKAVMWTGEHGFLDHTKPLKGDNQVFYPTPPKTVLPNPKLRDWDLSLSERTSNMLKNLERSLWITSYQMHHTGSGPANPLKIDNFKEKISDIPGANPCTAPLSEKSFPVFVPSKPRGGCRRRQGSTCCPAATELPNLSIAPDQGTASATMNQHRPQEITARSNKAPYPNQRGHSLSKYSSGSTEAQSAELSQEVLHKQQTESKSSAYGGRKRENCRVHFNVSSMQASMSQSSQEANATTERPLDVNNYPLSQEEMEVNREKSLCVKDEPRSKKEYFNAGRNLSSISQSAMAKDLAGSESHAELSSRATSEQEKLAKSRELPHSICNPCILPRPPVLPGLPSGDRVATVGGEHAALCLRDIQNSFSKSKAHHDFNSSITHAAVNLRDNVVTGKKHNFYGINSYYLHG
ncbi:uncharacterized protein C7orf31 homolog [Plectropomus leopardus]|uniref:uncharacterized protein C7orf31 homolog n=1 Tax=Plectropomus leopardus TaxID=160734 RepID=UPI001C4B6D02|nr:uncharacterized protein C7orf31 homolog [Plectropomus leopardus]XP_042345493.1 uncharacterized protein C7orf31 homolog [Plectropomus leopardus]XP_042345494.1 uncharacterized protein C7orf31 homolog [Plectropomus leopardus]XP_042345495.1 uncharacterized protein C7orf31 homolog [Plectropomus leopardus]XP_042345496.1 uncharacterized protein C7orf31 homolog [Plectropomus leopardus]XP_042345497.1 uncharacterized protein C7orf31 homolog [Plectropomus leopardus]